jgi:hypothetical protein
MRAQTEYLFVKADKLRPIANKFVRNLNEAPLTNNIQVCTAYFWYHASADGSFGL